tara:strand:- start:1567 stop:2154 length:588 start_codon:yes stop_codon:yes gene_type:complete
MSRMPIYPKETKLDVKTPPAMADRQLAQIGLLGKADAAIHSLMSTHLFPPVFIANAFGNTVAETAGILSGDRLRVALVIPPKVAQAKISLLATGQSAVVVVKSNELDGTAIDSTGVTFVVSTTDWAGGNWPGYKEAQQIFTQMAQFYEGDRYLTLKSSPDWDPDVIELKIHGDAGGMSNWCNVAGIYVQFVYPTV